MLAQRFTALPRPSAQGDSAWTAGTKAADAAVESATRPLIPLAREAFGVRPAY